MPSLLRLLSPRSAPPALQRDIAHLELADGHSIDVLRVRDPRAKRIKLSVGERGARLTLPLRASLVAGDRFMHEHRDWVAQQLLVCRGDITPLQRGVSATLPLRDAALALHWQEGRFAQIARDGDNVRFQLPAAAGDATVRRALRDFYEAEARADIARWMPQYMPGLPRPPSRIRLRVLSSQWGSLAPDGTLTLDLALVLGRPSAFEYVLVHELCHLIHANHSRAFWREVEHRCPDWHDARDYFRDHGRHLKASLHTLLNGA